MRKYLLLLLPIILSAQVIDTIIRFSDLPSELLYIPQGNELYVNFGRSNYLLVLDCSTYQTKKIIPIPSTYPSAAFGLWNWRRDKIYYSFNPDPDSIAVIDNQPDSIIKWIDWDGEPPSYNSINDRVYSTNMESLAVINCEMDSIIKIIPPPPQVGYLANFVLWDSIGNKVYCGSDWGDEVTVIDCTNDSVIGVISTNLGSPCAAVYNTQRRKLYVGGQWGSGCAVIDAIDDTMIKYLDIGYVEDIRPVWNSLEDKVYWPSSDSLYVIGCRNDSIIKRLRYLTGPMCLASWSNHLFIASDTWMGQWVGILRIMDCHTDSFFLQLRIGSYPGEMTCNPQDRRIYILTYDDSLLYVIRDEIPGIEEIASLSLAMTSGIEIYPNPAKSVIRVRVPWASFMPNASRPTLKIFDVSGKLIREIASPAPLSKRQFRNNYATSSKKVLGRNDKRIEISLKGINPGIYFLQFGKTI